jgi:menaquinone-dependent protoporphyrinogen oxidase
MKVLVSAASKHGATARIADAIAEALREAGVEPVVLEPASVQTIDDYDAAVIGSGVYAGQWLGPAKRLVQRHAEALKARPVWLFSSGPMGDPPKPEGDPTDVPPLVELIAPREHRVFSGQIDKGQLNFGEKLIVKAVRAPEGDFRPWDEIRAWAASIAQELKVGVPR